MSLQGPEGYIPRDDVDDGDDINPGTNKPKSANRLKHTLVEPSEYDKKAAESLKKAVDEVKAQLNEAGSDDKAA